MDAPTTNYLDRDGADAEQWGAAGSPTAAIRAAALAGVSARRYPWVSADVRFVGPRAQLQCAAIDACRR